MEKPIVASCICCHKYLKYSRIKRTTGELLGIHHKLATLESILILQMVGFVEQLLEILLLMVIVAYINNAMVVKWYCGAVRMVYYYIDSMHTVAIDIHNSWKSLYCKVRFLCLIWSFPDL